MSRCLTVAFVIAILVPAPSSAQSSYPGPFEQVTPGLSVSVIDDAGRRVEGRVVDVTDETVRVSVRKAIADIPIDRVVRIDKTDSLKNGALSGLSVGLALGIMGTMAVGEADPHFVTSALISCGAFWTAVGIGFDAMVDSRRTLYQRAGGVQARVSPLVGHRTRGAAISLRW